MTTVRAAVLADGSPPTRAGLDAAWPGWAVGIDLVIAADGGARLAPALGLHLQRWVGDGDSLDEAGRAAILAAGIEVRLAPTAKDESDTELGLLAAIEAGATEIVILGALGGPRPDHALANVALLGHSALAGTTIEILDPTARIRLLVGPGALDLHGRIGATVSLIPLEGVEGATSAGLRYPLIDSPLPFGPARGLSNVREANPASIRIRSGRLLVVEAPATLSA